MLLGRLILELSPIPKTMTPRAVRSNDVLGLLSRDTR